MIDIHCHLNFHKFEHDFDEVIKRAQEKGVSKIVNVGTSIDTSKWAVKLAEKYEDLYAIVGVHPHHADKIELGTNWIDELETLAQHPKTIGIGEIGMDYYSYASNGVVDPKQQKEIFEAQIELAYRLKLPLQIHHRQVGQELIDIFFFLFLVCFTALQEVKNFYSKL
jgi:TatD DNase family protein